MRAIVPLNDMSRRAPEAGRIRLGVKTAKAMKSIDTFRFTSQHENAIIQIAALYGGTPTAWNEPTARIKKQWQVITTSNKIEVLLPPGGLSTWYELWTGGGCARRCDGITTAVSVQTPDGNESQAVPCICTRNNLAECDPYTRMNVVLQGVDFAGTFRLETKGWNAAQELPGMFDMIAELSASGAMVKAFLHLEPRTTVTNGKKKNFVVPTLSVAATPQELLAGGGGAVPQLGAGGDQLAIESPSRGVDDPDVAGDDAIVDAEIVDDDEDLRVEDRARNLAGRVDIDPDLFVAALWADTNADLKKISTALDRADAGKIVPRLDGAKLSWETA